MNSGHPPHSRQPSKEPDLVHDKRATGDLIRKRSLAHQITTVFVAQSIEDGGDIRRRWADGRLDDLLSRGAGREAIVEVGTRFGLITPWTALVTSGESYAPLDPNAFPEGFIPFGDREAPPDDASIALEAGTTSTPSSRGALELLYRTLLGQRDEGVRACYDRKAASHPELSGRIELSIKIGLAGEIAAVQCKIDMRHARYNGSAAVLTFRTGAVGTLLHGCDATAKSIGLHVFGSDGTVRLKDWQFDGEMPDGTLVPGGIGEDRNGIFLEEMRRFLEAVRAQDASMVPCHLSDAIRTQAVLDALRASARTLEHHVVDMPDATEPDPAGA